MKNNDDEIKDNTFENTYKPASTLTSRRMRNQLRNETLTSETENFATGL